MQPIPVHPPLDLIRQFATGQIDAVQAATIAEHLASCAECAAAFDQLSLGRDPLIGKLRQCAVGPAGSVAEATISMPSPVLPSGNRAESPDRHLLFGLLAYQNDIISRSQLLAAFGAWCGDKSRALDEWLMAQRALEEEDRRALSRIVDRHVARAGGDATRSLTQLSSIASVRDALASLAPADSELQQTLAVVAIRRNREGCGDPTSADGTAGSPIRFKIIRSHAKGGLGEVYVATDQELNREVALKEIQPQFADHEENRTRFRLEAEITGNLEHPGIVPVYGLGQYDDGRPFYAMRFIRGDSMKEAIEQFHLRFGVASGARLTEGDASLELRKLLGRFVDVCNAIEYAHSRGVLHRDLKPGNVVLGKYGETLVVDWGLAKALGKTEYVDASRSPVQPTTDSRSAPTSLGSAIGTPAYMSPEQAAGRLDELGPATDVYSLGATLYHLFTGQMAIQGKSLTEKLQRVQSGEFRTPRAVRVDVPRPLEAICLKAMAVKTADRYATPLALAEDVERWLADEPVSVYREPLPARVRRLARRNQVTVTSLAVAVVVALAGLGVLSGVVSASNHRLNAAYTTIRDQNSAIVAKNAELQTTNLQLAAARTDAEQQRDAAIEQKSRADEQATIAIAVNDFLRNDLLGQADIANQELAHGERDRNITVRELLDRAAKAIEGKFQGQSLVEAAIRITIGDAFLGLGSLDDAERHLDAALKIRQANLAVNHPETLISRHRLALLYKRRGRFDEAETLYRQVLDVQCQTQGKDHPDTLSSMNDLAVLLEARGRYEEAETLAKQALNARRQVLGEVHPATLESMHNLATLNQTLGRFDEAQSLFNRTLELRRQKLGEDHPDTLRCLSNLAKLYLGHAQYDEAEPLYMRALEVRRRKLGENHPDTLKTMGSLALIYQYRDRFDEAEKLYQKVLEGLRQELDDDHPDILTIVNNLAAIAKSSGRVDEAETLYRQILEAQRRKLDDGHPDLLRTMNNLAVLLDSRSRYDEAEPLYKEALEAWRKKLSADHPDTLTSMINLATFYAKRGRHLEAEPLFKEALEARRRTLGEDAPQTLTGLNNLAAFYQSQARFDEAEPLYLSAVAGAKSRFGIDHLTTQTYVRNLVSLYQRMMKHDSAEPLLRELAEFQKQNSGADSVQYAAVLISLGVNLIVQRRDVEGTETLTSAGEILKRDEKAGPESAAMASLRVQWGQALLDTQQYQSAEGQLRECVTLRQKLVPDDWSMFNAQSLLGASLVGQKKFADAEPLLLSGYAGLKAAESNKKLPATAKSRPTEALQRLIELYTAWEKPDELSKWQKISADTTSPDSAAPESK